MSFPFFIVAGLLVAHLAGAACIVHLLLSRKSNTALILWTLWLLLLPIPGIGLYWFLGNDRIRKKRLQQYRQSRGDDANGGQLADDDIAPVVRSTAAIPGNRLSALSGSVRT